MKIDGITKKSLLFDFYGALLTSRQREVMQLYNDENLSLAEIAQEAGISRQGVHDALKKAERALESYESKLGLVDKFKRSSNAIEIIDSRIDELICEISAGTGNPDGDKYSDRSDLTGEHIVAVLQELRIIIDKLED